MHLTIEPQNTWSKKQHNWEGETDNPEVSETSLSHFQ